MGGSLFYTPLEVYTIFETVSAIALNLKRMAAALWIILAGRRCFVCFIIQFIALLSTRPTIDGTKGNPHEGLPQSLLPRTSSDA